ncbi:SCO-spondin [Elysia marginata]|uniref:SCO-spondin n=1 Tax=Elysia marginata TaxID=1093978 RepID=A0AAV4HA90_9GAST|nr:SCO-spondin [Elysia marginata]
MSDLAKLPLGSLQHEPDSGDVTKTGFGNFVVGSACHGRLSLSLELPVGGQLSRLHIDGSYTSYRVFIVDAQGNEQPQADGKGNVQFTSSDNPVDFSDAVVPTGGEIVIRLTGPGSGFQVEVTQLVLCLPDVNFCKLGTAQVQGALQFLPLDDILGVNGEDAVVSYGDDGDYIQDGVVVTGSCYQCTCMEDTLKCSETSDCEGVCPAHTTECVGPCGEAVLVTTFAAKGVHPHCKVDQSPCVPASCTTTPAECPGPWSPWSACQNCFQFRHRECHADCPEECSTRLLRDVQKCPECVPTTGTPGFCKDSEEWTCVNSYDECQQSCAVYMKESSCAGLLQEESCVEKCACKEGYLRDATGECVMKGQCECYEGVSGSTPIPQGFHVNVGNCVYCQCTAGGYTCKEREDCCEISNWSEWSDCSVQCGTGTQTRTRQKYGQGCGNDTQLKEEKACTNDGCPCVHRGQVFESNTVYEDNCKKCECKNGNFQCTVTKGEDEEYPNDECTRMCRCTSEGEEMCLTALPPSCKQNRESCDSMTHVQRPTNNSCCPDCVPVMKPCALSKDSIILSMVHTVHGNCRSQNQVEINSCSGTCGYSSVNSSELLYKDGRFELSTEASCKCCKATRGSQEQRFLCDDETVLNLDVDVITGCGCKGCDE